MHHSLFLFCCTRSLHFMHYSLSLLCQSSSSFSAPLILNAALPLFRMLSSFYVAFFLHFRKHSPSLSHCILLYLQYMEFHSIFMQFASSLIYSILLCSKHLTYVIFLFPAACPSPFLLLFQFGNI